MAQVRTCGHCTKEIAPNDNYFQDAPNVVKLENGEFSNGDLCVSCHEDWDPLGSGTLVEQAVEQEPILNPENPIVCPLCQCEGEYYARQPQSSEYTLFGFKACGCDNVWGYIYKNSEKPELLIKALDDE